MKKLGILVLFLMLAFVTQADLIDDLITRDLLTKDSEGCWLPPAHSFSVPRMLKQLITQRVSRLGTPAAQVLSIGAVAGEAWSLKVVAPLAALPEDDLLNAVESARQGGVSARL